MRRHVRSFTKWLLLTMVLLLSFITGHHAQASEQRATVPLESLPPIANHGVRVLSQSSTGMYGGKAIESGMQLVAKQGNFCNTREASDIVYPLQGRFTRMSGTAYYDDKSNTEFSVQIIDLTNPNNGKILWTGHVGQGGQFAFSATLIKVESLQVKMISDPFICNISDNATADVVAVLNNSSTPAKTPSPSPARPSAIPLYPVGNTGVPADSKVLFAWRPYMGAVNYAFHIWLVKQSGTVALTPATPNTASTTIFRKT